MDPLTIIRDADAARDELEWRKLEQEHAELWGNVWDHKRKAVACGVKHSNTAHPGSYRPDLPLSHAALTRTTKAERQMYAARPLELFPCRELQRPAHAEMSGQRAIERARSRFAELSIVPSVRPSL